MSVLEADYATTEKVSCTIDISGGHIVFILTINGQPLGSETQEWFH